MKFLPKCRTKKFRMTYTICESFCSFLNWEGADIRRVTIVAKSDYCDSIDIAILFLLWTTIAILL